MILGEVFYKEFIYGKDLLTSKRVRRIWTEPSLKTYSVMWEQYLKTGWMKINNPAIFNELESAYQKKIISEEEIEETTPPSVVEPKPEISSLEKQKNISKKPRKKVISNVST